MTQDELEIYVKSLPEEMQKIFVMADRYVIEAADTLGDDFQIAADIVSVFEKYAKRRKES